jgi:hypothetical protein
MRALIERLFRHAAPVVAVDPHPTARYLAAITEAAAIERLGHAAR